eukprot:NODE_4587_length_766_cov_243.021909_g4428_i0.p1 GENE.NODE_4587_length_766_cov_243.021909_g4428_i0~~NODE_4587_length_766_cov_243.021909_g4428_i0.p1  ORF type:complete len:194 (+),score=0.92 NODE_4587_length_766_cov_243.021909_g4428_i0:87-668(+)
MDHLAPQACGRTRGELDKLLKESDYGGNKNAFNAFFVPATNPAERPEILPKCKECSNPIGAHQAAAAGSPRTPTPSVAPDEPDRHPATGNLFQRIVWCVFQPAPSSAPSSSSSPMSALTSPLLAGSFSLESGQTHPSGMSSSGYSCCSRPTRSRPRPAKGLRHGSSGSAVGSSPEGRDRGEWAPAERHKDKYN